MFAELLKKDYIAKDTMEMQFLVHTENHVFKPGQYAKVRIPLTYKDERGDTRKFSIVNAPMGDKVLTFAFRDTGSGYKKTLSEMPIGCMVEIMKIKGEFVLEKSVSVPLVFIAGGIGITPFLSMLRFMEKNKQFPHVTLFYFNRTKEETAYFDELMRLDKQSNMFTVIFSMTQDPYWQGEHRRISEDLLKSYSIDINSLFYVVGTLGMVQYTQQVLLSWGVEPQHIILEDFDEYK